jgi:hypothetical protein
MLIALFRPTLTHSRSARNILQASDVTSGLSVCAKCLRDQTTSLPNAPALMSAPTNAPSTSPIPTMRATMAGPQENY